MTSCERCGAAAVQRRAGRGQNIGQFFWGCSTYPKCRWTRAIAGVGPTSDPEATTQRPTPTRHDIGERELVLGGAVVGVPGGSARREYERRSSRDAANRPKLLYDAAVSSIVLAVVIAVLFQVATRSDGLGIALLIGGSVFVGRLLPRLTTIAWSTGADGEAATAGYLDPLADLGFVVMHDVSIPRSRANIDHLVIGPTGVFVIETKNIRGKVRIDGETVRIGGRRVEVVDEVRREVEAVVGVLGPYLREKGVGIAAIVCAHRAELPWLRRDVARIRLAYPKNVGKLILDGPTLLSEPDVAELRALASQWLPTRSPRDRVA